MKNASSQEREQTGINGCLTKMESLAGVGCLPLWSKCHSSQPSSLQLNTPKVADSSFLGIAQANCCFLDGYRCIYLYPKYALFMELKSCPKRSHHWWVRLSVSSHWILQPSDLLGSRWVIQIIQQFVINYLIRPNSQRVAEEYKNPPKAPVTAWKKMSHQLQRHKS